MRCKGDDVEVGSSLQTLKGETVVSRNTTADAHAQLDINSRYNGFFDSCSTRTFIDEKIFIPYAKICLRSMLDSYQYHESIKN